MVAGEVRWQVWKAVVLYCSLDVILNCLVKCVLLNAQNKGEGLSIVLCIGTFFWLC